MRARPWPRVAAAVVLLALVLSACGPVLTLEAPRLEHLQPHPPEQSIVYDAAGNQLAILRKEFRQRVALDRIPQDLQNAVLAAEDRGFWSHAGVDVRALARAALVNAVNGVAEQGASTITQQLVKNLYMPEAARDLHTKAREALLARDLEQRLSKREILEEYLNTIYFGSGAYGVQAAAESYWRKDVSQLDLAEAALLAGIVRAPETLDPRRNPGWAQERRDDVLRAMLAEGFAPLEAVEAAVARPVEVQPPLPAPTTTQPYWVDFVVRTLLEDPSFGPDETARAERLYGGGLRIHTTLRPELQVRAEEAAHRTLNGPQDPEVAVVSVEPATGAIVAAVGGRDYRASQFDLATQARRQPGSTFKTFVLVAALAAGWRPDSPINGDQGVIREAEGQPFVVMNYDNVSYGPISLLEATRRSVNAAFARLILDVGVDRTIAAARALGVTSPLNEDAGIALGGLEQGVSPLEMAASYATLANLGMRIPVSPIDRIEDAVGEAVWRPDRTPLRALDPGVAWLATTMLKGVVENGTAEQARLEGWEVAGKTGTTSDYTDAWFVGYTPNLSTAVWIGYPQGRIPLREVHGEPVVSGGSWPARIWHDFQQSALAGRPPERFVLPKEAYVEVDIDPRTGLLAAPWCRGERRMVPRVLLPKTTCPWRPPDVPLTASPTASPTPTPSPSTTATASASPLPTPTLTRLPLPGPRTPTPTPSSSATPSPTPSPEPTPTPTSTSPSPTPTPTSPSPSPTP